MLRLSGNSRYPGLERGDFGNVGCRRLRIHVSCGPGTGSCGGDPRYGFPEARPGDQLVTAQGSEDKAAAYDKRGDDGGDDDNDKPPVHRHLGQSLRFAAVPQLALADAHEEALNGAIHAIHGRAARLHTHIATAWLVQVVLEGLA